jgi:hypothetical protein
MYMSWIASRHHCIMIVVGPYVKFVCSGSVAYAHAYAHIGSRCALKRDYFSLTLPRTPYLFAKMAMSVTCKTGATGADACTDLTPRPAAKQPRLTPVEEVDDETIKAIGGDLDCDGAACVLSDETAGATEAARLADLGLEPCDLAVISVSELEEALGAPMTTALRRTRDVAIKELERQMEKPQTGSTRHIFPPAEQKRPATAPPLRTSAMRSSTMSPFKKPEEHTAISYEKQRQFQVRLVAK